MAVHPALEAVRPSQAGGAGIQANLALHHLFAACRFSAIVAQVERDNAERPLGAFWEEILHNSLGVAALTVTFLESYANDLSTEGLTTLAGGAAMAPARDGGDTEGILGKYSTALTVLTGRRLDYGVEAVRNVDALIKLRNEVVRLHSLCPDEGARNDKLAELLTGRFSLSAYFPGESALPRAWASYSFASWALQSTVEFLDYIYAEAGVPSPIEKFKTQLAALCGNVIPQVAGRKPG